MFQSRAQRKLNEQTHYFYQNLEQYLGNFRPIRNFYLLITILQYLYDSKHFFKHLLNLRTFIKLSTLDKNFFNIQLQNYSSLQSNI